MAHNSPGNANRDALLLELAALKKETVQALNNTDQAMKILAQTGKLPPPENVLAFLKPGQMALACEAAPKSPACPGRSFEVRIVKVGERAAFICHACYRMFERLHRMQLAGPYANPGT